MNDSEQSNATERFESLDQSMLVRVCPELGVLIAWNGSATFNVFRIPDLEPIDCYTRYYVKAGYGPRDGKPEPSFSQAMHWAAQCVAGIVRTLEGCDGENDDD